MPIPTQPQDASGVMTDAAQDTTTIIPPPPDGRLRARDTAGILVRAVGRARSDHATNLAQAVAFNLFLAIPAAALASFAGVIVFCPVPGARGRDESACVDSSASPSIVRMNVSKVFANSDMHTSASSAL